MAETNGGGRKEKGIRGNVNGRKIEYLRRVEERETETRTAKLAQIEKG